MTDQSWNRTPGQGRYARLERERRFLVTRVPAPLEDGRLIEDRYLAGGTLRLRAVRGDSEPVFKLTQKVRPNAADPSVVAITNLYLSEDEYWMLVALPGADLTKTRSLCGGFAVDVFHGSLDGLMLAEIEVESPGHDVVLPTWIGDEVTGDEGYSGGSLARTQRWPL